MKAFLVTHAGLLAMCALFALAFCMSCEEKVERYEVVESRAAEAHSAAEAQAKTLPAPPTPPPWADRVSPDGGFPCEVDKVLAVSCRRCHWEPRENEAPFALVRYDDIERMRSGKPISKLMEQMVEADLMPPLDEPVEPKVTPLTLKQKETLLKWLADGAPRSDEKCP